MIATLSLLPLALAALPQEPYPAQLPPVQDWNGASRALVATADDPWITPAERSGLTRTPTYDETMDWLERLVAASDALHKTTIGVSPEGRDIVMIVASSAREFTPEQMREGSKARVLAHGGIHAGEIDGKDAGLMLLRDLTVGGRAAGLLDEVNLLFVPIFNVDGHERRSAYGRVNQRGPAEMGWRTNARNLNLNRDYAKADTPEMQAMIRAIGRWQPDLYLDLHVTDGADYQYDVTFGSNGAHGWSPEINTWLEGAYREGVAAALTEQGHVPGPLIFAANGYDMSGGRFQWTASPRFSNGYGDARHLPTVLVENHSLKPYDRRVLGTYVLLEASLRVLARDIETLRAAVAADRARRPASVHTRYEVSRPAEISFRGIRSRRRESDITGDSVTEWLGEPVDETIPLIASDRRAGEVPRPTAYWVPAAWRDVIERLALHGVEMEILAEPRELELELDRLLEPELAPAPFEGRVRLAAQTESFRRTLTLPVGSARVPTDQDLGDLAVLLLEPSSEDSFFQWGFFLEVLSRTEYMEPYVTEPLARRMLEADPELRDAFEKALEDEDFAADANARLAWFYEKTPYFDERWQVYPVGRER